MRERWAQALIERGRRSRPTCRTRLVRQRMDELQQALEALEPEEDLVEPLPERRRRRAPRAQRTTAVPLDRLRALNDALLAAARRASPIHRKLEKARERRRHALDDAGRTRRSTGRPPRSWRSRRFSRTASPIRLTGQDVERGTFSQRHAVLSRRDDGRRVHRRCSVCRRRGRHSRFTTARFGERGGRVRVRLQRAGARAARHLGSAVRRLHQRRPGDDRRVRRVGARQVGADAVARLAAAARARRTGARITRARGPSGFCSSRPTSTCAWRTARRPRSTSICCAARRRCCGTDPLPLIVLTPKSLLRHPLVASTPRELAEGRWQQVIDDPAAAARSGDVRRLLSAAAARSTWIS